MNTSILTCLYIIALLFWLYNACLEFFESSKVFRSKNPFFKARIRKEFLVFSLLPLAIVLFHFQNNKVLYFNPNSFCEEVGTFEVINLYIYVLISILISVMIQLTDKGSFFSDNKYYFSFQYLLPNVYNKTNEKYINQQKKITSFVSLDLVNPASDTKVIEVESNIPPTPNREEKDVSSIQNNICHHQTNDLLKKTIVRDNQSEEFLLSIIEKYKPHIGFSFEILKKFLEGNVNFEIKIELLSNSPKSLLIELFHELFPLEEEQKFGDKHYLTLINLKYNCFERIKGRGEIIQKELNRWRESKRRMKIK